MVSRLARVLMIVRDAVQLVLGFLVVGSQISKIGEEPVFLVTVPLGALLLLLAVVDLGLNISKRKWRRVFVLLSVLSILPGLLFLLLVAVLGAPVVLLNILVLVFLREKKTAEERALHPPVAITRNYRVVAAIGALVMLAGLFVPLAAISGTTLSLFGVYYAIVAHSGLPSFSLDPVSVIFVIFALFFSPVAVILAALGMRWRKLSFVSGLVGLVAGGGLLYVLTASGGFAGYLIAAGAVLELVAFIVLRPKKTG